MSNDHTTIQVDRETAAKIHYIKRVREDSNNRETVRFLVEQVEFEDKSHADGSPSRGIIVEDVA